MTNDFIDDNGDELGVSQSHKFKQSFKFTFSRKKTHRPWKKTSLLQNRPLGSELHSFFYDSPKAGFAPEDLSRKVGLFSILSFFLRDGDVGPKKNNILGCPRKLVNG